jgi:hypothetical protein
MPEQRTGPIQAGSERFHRSGPWPVSNFTGSVRKEIAMRHIGKFCVVMAAILWTCMTANGRCEEPQAGAVKPDRKVDWDMKSFAEIVKPMQHSTKGRMPLLLWNFPIPRGDELVKFREDGSLRRWIDQMAELNRHLWLRGCDSLHLFNLGFPGSGVPVTFSLESVEDARAMHDEMLTWREFLDRGKPMSYAVPKSVEDEAVWSGLELGNRCLIRAASLGKADRKVEVRRASGKTSLLDAPREGATYMIQSDNQIIELGHSSKRVP